MKSLSTITAIEENKNACERRNQNSKRYVFIVKGFVDVVGLTYFPEA
jgi:hypothetical protein